MPSGIFQFFLTPNELHAQLDEIRCTEQLYLILELDRFATPRVRILAPDRLFAPDSLPDTIFLSRAMPTFDGTRLGDLGDLAYTEGWVYLRFGGYQGGVLYMFDLCFKSSREDAQQLFQHIRKSLKKALTPGVKLTGPEGEDVRILQNTYYSPGAKEYFERGVPWRQRGLPNSWFSPE